MGVDDEGLTIHAGQHVFAREVEHLDRLGVAELALGCYTQSTLFFVGQLGVVFVLLLFEHYFSGSLLELRDLPQFLSVDARNAFGLRQIRNAVQLGVHVELHSLDTLVYL